MERPSCPSRILAACWLVACGVEPAPAASASVTSDAGRASIVTAGSDGGGGLGAVNAGGTRALDAGGASATGGAGAPLDTPGWPQVPDDPRREAVPAGTVQLGWAQLDAGKSANYDGGDSAETCPDPDEMVTPGTVDFQRGVWTLTGSGEGFIHGWDQGNLVYFKTKIAGDFTFTMKVEALEMLDGSSLDGAAQALLNVRDDLGSKRPTHSIVAGAAPSKAIFMARYSWSGENGKWWYWPAWPSTWPDHRETRSWTRLVARGDAISAESSSDGVSWQRVEHNDQNASHPDWYPFRLTALSRERYVGLVCSARNDRNYAPMTQLPGKSVSCRDPQSTHLRKAARCVFSHVTLTQP